MDFNCSDDLIIVNKKFLLEQFSSLKSEMRNEFNDQVKALKQEDVLLTEDRVAEILGVCERTVRNRLKERKMSYSEIKGKRYVRSSELDRYIYEHTIPRKNHAA